MLLAYRTLDFNENCLKFWVLELNECNCVCFLIALPLSNHWRWIISIPFHAHIRISDGMQCMQRSLNSWESTCALCIVHIDAEHFNILDYCYWCCCIISNSHHQSFLFSWIFFIFYSIASSGKGSVSVDCFMTDGSKWVSLSWNSSKKKASALRSWIEKQTHTQSTWLEHLSYSFGCTDNQNANAYTIVCCCCV